MMTEEEAKTKWCHQSPNNEVWPCSASNCMAWRWGSDKREMKRVHKAENGKYPYDATAGSLRILDGESWRYESTDIDADGEFERIHRASPETGDHRQGYCGLAGRPE